MDHAEFSGDAGLQWRDGIERETSMEERTGEKLSAVAQLPFAASFAVAGGRGSGAPVGFCF